MADTVCVTCGGKGWGLFDLKGDWKFSGQCPVCKGKGVVTTNG